MITASRLADAVLPVLGEMWRDADGDFHFDARAVETIRLALAAPNPDPALLNNAANAAGRHLFHHERDAQRAYREVLQPALAKIKAIGAMPTHRVLHIVCDVARLIGDANAWENAIEIMIASHPEGVERARVLLYVAQRDQHRGDVDAAERAYTEAAEIFLNAGEKREWAMALGGIAGILEARGNLDEALHILTQNELSVYERLGDVQSMAITLGKIADIMQARGELDEALRIYWHEQLPVYDRLGDVRSKAITLGQIAGILEARGELDEAIRIYTQEELPVYERLGDVRSKANTQGKIADILQLRGEVDEALRIRRLDELPVYERLGDVRSKAMALHKIASTRIHRGDHRTGGIQQIFKNLVEAYAIVRKIDEPVGIGAVGELLAQIHTLEGRKAEALSILDNVKAAYAKLGNNQAVDRVRKRRREIEGA